MVQVLISLLAALGFLISADANAKWMTEGEYQEFLDEVKEGREPVRVDCDAIMDHQRRFLNVDRLEDVVSLVRDVEQEGVGAKYVGEFLHGLINRQIVLEAVQYSTGATQSSDQLGRLVRTTAEVARKSFVGNPYELYSSMAAWQYGPVDTDFAILVEALWATDLKIEGEKTFYFRNESEIDDRKGDLLIEESQFSELLQLLVANPQCLEGCQQKILQTLIRVELPGGKVGRSYLIGMEQILKPIIESAPSEGILDGAFEVLQKKIDFPANRSLSEAVIRRAEQHDPSLVELVAAVEEHLELIPE